MLIPQDFIAGDYGHAAQAGFGTIINSLYLIAVGFFALAIAYNHLQIITHEYTLDYNETGMLVTTATIAEGGNPYSLESQPIRISLYPVLYNVLVAPLTRVFGNTLELLVLLTGYLSWRVAPSVSIFVAGIM